MNRDDQTPIDAETLNHLQGLGLMRDRISQELAFRSRSGRRYNTDMKDLSDTELTAELTWLRNKIDKVLQPYEGK